MHEYWKKKRQEALDAMRRLTGQDVEDNCEDMERALEYSFRNGNSKEAAKAVSDFFTYMWAVNEIKAHEMAPAK